MIRGADRWLLPCLTAKSYAVESVSRVFIVIADHFEPYHKAPDRDEALRRMAHWHTAYPESIADRTDTAGRSPRHSFFYPIERYDEEIMKRLAALCEQTGSEVEVHLHHANDTAASLRDKMQRGLEQLMRHGLLSRAADGTPRFCFIHGDWALANCHPEGSNCGVPNEIAVLRELGCIADMTFPSAPSATQPRRVNSIYYTANTGNPATLGQGPAATCGKVSPCRESPDHLLLINGIATLNWSKRKWGLLPGLENSDITGANPPTPERWNLWLRHAPRVLGKPDWAFVKLHTHGAPPWNSAMHLGQPMQAFRRFLAEQPVPYNYITAREMVNVIHALEDGAQEFSPGLLSHVYGTPKP